MKVSYDFALEATRKYLQSIVFVDDKIYYEAPVKKVAVDIATPRSMKIYKPLSKPEEHLSAKNDAIDTSNSQVIIDEEFPFHPKQLVESFAKERMVCALYEPDDGFSTDNESELFKLCERADVVILDWEFYKNAGDNILPLIENLMSASQTTVPHHVRLCAIYTTTPDLRKVASQIYDYLKAAKLEVKPDGDLDLNAGSSRIIVLGKPTTGRPQDLIKQAEVVETDLASRIIKEFALMHEGILPSMALDSLATVRTNSKKILDKFHADMDGAFLIHRGLVLPDDDAFEQIPELIAEEALAVMYDNQIAPEQAKQIADEIIDSYDLNIDWKLKNGKSKSVSGEVAQKLLKEGRKKIRKYCDPDAVKLKELHEAVSEKGYEAAKQLATLYNTRTQYGARKDLRFGTIVRRIINKEYEYSLCLMPLCDCVRLSIADNKVHYFPFWKLRLDNEKHPSKGMVVELPLNKEFLELYSMGKPRDQMWMEGFKASPSKTVTAIETDGKFIFQGEVDKLEWIAQLKPSHAQRIAHDIGASFSRVGVIEAEWLRLIAERQQ